jgi:hypothetical protein
LGWPLSLLKASNFGTNKLLKDYIHPIAVIRMGCN